MSSRFEILGLVAQLGVCLADYIANHNATYSDTKEKVSCLVIESQEENPLVVRPDHHPIVQTFTAENRPSTRSGRR